MTRVIDFADEHPSLAPDGVPPPSPDSSQVSRNSYDRIFKLNQEFQKGPLIFNASASSGGSDTGSVNPAQGFTPPENPAPPTVAGGADPLVTLVELGDVEWVGPNQWYRLQFDPSRLRLAHGGGGIQLLVQVDPDNELEVETVAASGCRTIGIQVKPATVSRDIQYNPEDCAPEEPTDVSTASTTTALREHEQFVAHRELTKYVILLLHL